MKALLTFLSSCDDLFLGTIVFDTFNPGIRHYFDAALAEDADQQTTYFFIDGSQDIGQHFQNSYFCADCIKHTGQLYADYASANADQAVWCFGKIPAGVAID